MFFKTLHMKMHIPYNLVIPFLNLYQCFSDFSEYQISLEDLLNPSFIRPPSQSFQFNRSGWGPQNLLSSKFPGDGADGPGTTL